MTRALRMIVVGLLCGLVGSAVGQGVVYVNGITGNDDWNGRCEVWNGGICGPKATIQDGIDTAGAGDQVLIADGIYTGLGNRDLDFRGQPITVRSASGNPATCIIDCERLGRGFVFQSGETASSTIDGLTIRNGNAERGGGVFCSYASPRLDHCDFSGNVAGSGGGINCEGGNPTLVDCAITGNTASDMGGGGIHCELAQPTLINCRISDNASLVDAGGLYCASSSPALFNCVITANAADDNGGGIFCDLASGPTLTNCTLTGNRSAGPGGGAFCPTARPTMTNCILWANLPQAIHAHTEAPTITYSDVQGGWPGVGNIDADPQFAFASDGHLLPGSPCIDAGTPGEPGWPVDDIEGQPRALDGDGDGAALPDMGAFEFNPAAPTIAVSAAELVLFVPVGQSISQPLAIRNSSLGTLAWQLDSQADWLHATPAAGESSGEVDTVTLTASTDTLSHGRYETRLWVTDPLASNSPLPIAVTLYVNSALRVPDEFATIQAAIDAAVAGDEVLLADGLYTGPGNRGLDFGGKSITVRSVSGEPAACIIDCERQACGFTFHTAETAAARVDGLTITGGHGPNQGGGVFCSGASPTLSNCVIMGNSAPTYGGGVHCLIGATTLVNCTIKDNAAARHGGGVYCTNEHATLTNCVISGNTANDCGGGVYCLYGSILTNCTIADNTAASAGGGLYCWSSPGPIVTNCILWANAPEEIGIDRGAPAITFSDVQGGWTGTGNIATDPLFALPGDWHLVPQSPCLDAGNNNVLPALLAEDIEGQARLIDADGDGQALVDMGAYELNPALPAIAVSPTALTFFVAPDSSDSQTLTISTCSLGTLAWELTWNADWLSASVTSGQSSGEANTITLTANTYDLAPGYYQAVLWVTDPHASNSPYAVSVVLHATRTLNVPAEYATIQAAIDVANHRDEVVLADGTYTGLGNRDLDFGGKPITVRSASGNPAACVIDCESAGRGFLFNKNEGADSIVSAIAIRNAHEGAGAGILCSDSSPTIANCIISDGTGSDGVGVCCWFASPTLVNCTISGNTSYNATGGAGFNCSGLNCRPTLIDCTITGNSTYGAWNGAGVYCRQASPTLVNCVISDNTDYESSDGGAGVYCYFESSARLINCTITGNRTSAHVGGGVACDWRSTPTLTNCILWANTPEQIYVSDSEPLVTYCDVQGGWTGTGNIDADPLFADADGPNGDPTTWEDNDYRLTAGSPCVDVGDPAFIPLPGALDLDGHAPLWDGDGDSLRRIDLGAYEYGSHAYGDLNCDGHIDTLDIDPFVAALVSAPDFVAYEASYDGCDALLADVNNDGHVNVFDIDAFVVRLTGERGDL